MAQASFLRKKEPDLHHMYVYKVPMTPYSYHSQYNKNSLRLPTSPLTNLKRWFECDLQPLWVNLWAMQRASFTYNTRF